MPSDVAQLRALFDELIQIPASERPAALEARCKGDNELQRRLEKLIASAEDNTSFLSAPTADISLHLMPLTAEPTRESVPLTEQAGTQIGRYKLLEQIGEGGFGAVYVAEQKSPIKRRVALKILKLGMDTRAVVARFEAERQALAMMDHPNIAKVFDAGTTDTGRPYFAMELVRGIPITEYCDQNNLPPSERLKLFVEVCHAIQHAHQKGVIHRDIKPTNILVTLHDGVPVPKVIDFGIAKATQGNLTDKTVYTQFQQFIGTPAYMSPEQAEMSGLDVDTRSDIYSLGVLLYELLTGLTPFGAKELMKGGVDEMRRTIRQTDPPRPSNRISGMTRADSTSTARRRGMELHRLIGLLRGDLDWIVMKCLEKDRTRRYETADAVATDIQRHLNNEPITARPPSTVYRFQKTVRRNKFAFAAASAVAAALMIGLAASTWMFFRERTAHQQAVVAEQAQAKLRQAAESAAKKSQEVLDFIQGMFGKAGDNYADRVTVSQMLDMGVADVDKQFQNEPDVLASIQYSAGYCYSKIGQWDKARSYLQKAADLESKIFGYENPDTLNTLRELASVALSQGRNEEAEALCNKIISSAKAGMANNQLPADQKSEFRHIELAACGKLKQEYMVTGQLSKAEALSEEMLKAVRSKELTGLSAIYVWDEAGTLALDEGHPREALKDFESGLAGYQLAGYHMTEGVQLAWDEELQGEAYLALSDYPKAETLLTWSLPILLHRFGASHFEVQRGVRALMTLYSKTHRPDLAAEWKSKLDKLNQEQIKKKSQKPGG